MEPCAENSKGSLLSKHLDTFIVLGKAACLELRKNVITAHNNVKNAVLA
jgi:hypothetical protein